MEEREKKEREGNIMYRDRCVREKELICMNVN